MHPVLRYARASQAAYWAANGQIDAVTAELGQCGLSIVGIRDLPETDMHLFAARDQAALVFAFCGTRDLRNWVRDAEASIDTWVGCRLHTNAAHVHHGFVSGWASVRDWCAAVAMSMRPLPIVVTGHSLGGALATLAACDMPGTAPIRAYTYGSPRVGTADFAAAYDDCGSLTTRVVHDDDIVSTLPGTMFYRHVSGELRLRDDGSVVGTLGTLWRRLADFNRQVVADIDGRAEKDHAIDRYVAACGVYAAAQAVSA